ncbi:protein of unknown function [Mesonia phycicola]|uniref:Uncharacterized protein n=1 Tax=Mesonia phycicola TaxID=579105 RepID=A0A1M6A3C7_9FLAO|nr:DUF748 domain-containing protein [Mesonia phycicola]SHI30849.1 protein of unknown function [Mesonia phycicola]
MSKGKKILIGILVIILLVLFFLPGIIKDYAINNSKELIGRKIDIKELHYNYLSSTAKVYNFKMLEENNQDEFIKFDTLIVNLEPYKLLFNETVIEQFYIDGLTVNTTLKDSVFNFDDLIAFHTQENDTVTTEESETVKYDISNIELKNANFFFNNKNVDHTTHIDDFSIFMDNISWNKEEKSNADIKFNFKNGGYLETSLNINPADGDYDAQVTINNLILDPFYKYALEYADINSLKGILNSKILIEGNTNNPINTLVSGKVNIDDFALTDKNNKEVIKSKKISSALKLIDYANATYELDSLTLSTPYIYFEMDSITNNLVKLFKVDTEDNTLANEEYKTQIDTTATGLHYTINNFIVKDGIMDYRNNLTGKNFDYHLNDIKINSDKIDSQADWVNINANMLLNNRGNLDAKLGYNPQNLDNLNLGISIEKFQLSDINIYSQYYMGHSVLVGDFYYYSTSKLTNANLISENQLLVKNPKVKNEKNGLYSLPLKFALFILKDKNNEVRLEVPVRGNLNNPEINIGKIVWTTLKNRITGTAASPVTTLSTLVDVNPKDYEELVFKYTDTIPDENNIKKLHKLLEIETLKKGLKIELAHFVDTDLQRDAIVFSELGKKYFQEKNKNYLEDQTGFQNYINTKVAIDSLSVKEKAYTLINSKTADSLVNIYNKTLEKNITTALTTAKDSTNITVKSLDIKQTENVNSAPRFKINFDLLEE